MASSEFTSYLAHPQPRRENAHFLQLLTILPIVLLAFIGCGQQHPAAVPTPTPRPPVHYAATISDGSWSFTFDVDPAGTTVKPLVLKFPHTFECGGQRLQFYDANGNAIAPEDPYTDPLPITNGQFMFEHKATPGDVTIMGSIAQSASGTWMISGGGGFPIASYSCQGTWTAIRK